MTATASQGRIYKTSADLAAHIRETAATVVRNVNPGREHSGPAFDAEVAEVADAMARKLCRINTEAGRPDIARQIRLAWESAQ